MLDIAATVDCVQSPHGVSVLGFCWGGGVMIRAAAELNLRGAIAFYGTRLPTYLDQKPKCPLLFHFAKTDPNSTPEIIEQVRKAFPSAETYIYEAGHAFANDVRPAYVEAAAKTRAQPHASISSSNSIRPPAERAACNDRAPLKRAAKCQRGCLPSLGKTAVCNRSQNGRVFVDCAACMSVGSLSDGASRLTVSATATFRAFSTERQ